MHKSLFFMPSYNEFLSCMLHDFSPTLKNSWNWDPIIRIISISNRRSKKRRWENFPFVMVIFFFDEKKIVLLNENKICGSGYIYPSSIHLHLHRKYNKVSTLKIVGGQGRIHHGPSVKCVIKNTFLFFISIQFNEIW